MAIKAVNMLLKEERKGERPKFPKEEKAAKTFAGVIIGGNRKSYKTCGKMHRPMCYIERPDLAPKWY